MVRQGRMTVQAKPDGGVRGIVAGDVIRRLVARTMAQQLGDACGGGYRTVPVRPLHESRVRVRGARIPGLDRNQPIDHSHIREWCRV